MGPDHRGAETSPWSGSGLKGWASLQGAVPGINERALISGGGSGIMWCILPLKSVQIY